MFVGGDDVAMPNRVREQIETLKANAADIVFSLPVLIDAEDRQLRSDAHAIFFNRKLSEFHSAPLRSFFFHGNFLCAPSACLRRELFDQIGKFSPGLIQLQDFEYWIRIAKRGLRFYVSEEPVVRYRWHRSNLSSEKHGVRSRLEWRHIMRHFFDCCAVGPRNSILGRDLALEVGLVHYAAEITAIIAFLNHESPEIREIGFHQAIALLEKGRDAELEAARVGITPRNLFDVIGSQTT
jgi:GT2 family glycosyltransferase